MECLSKKPGPENIIYTGNPENDYLKVQLKRQQAILDKLGVVNHLLQVYAPDENLHKTALEEQTKLRKEFEQVQADREKGARLDVSCPCADPDRSGKAGYQHEKF